MIMRLIVLWFFSLVVASICISISIFYSAQSTVEAPTQYLFENVSISLLLPKTKGHFVKQVMTGYLRTAGAIVNH